MNIPNIYVQEQRAIPSYMNKTYAQNLDNGDNISQVHKTLTHTTVDTHTI